MSPLPRLYRSRFRIRGLCAPARAGGHLHAGLGRFSAELLHHSFQTNENTTLSPYSVLTALAMAAGGANDETLREMETVFGLPGAEIYRAPFSVKTINNWIAEHTKDRLKEVIDSLDPTAALCLVNALTFDDKWQDEFEENNIREKEVIRRPIANRVHGNLTSAGFSASPIGKYHYPCCVSWPYP